MGSGSTLLSNEEIEASERVRAMGKLAVYTPKAVVEHVIPPERLTQSWFRRRAAWQAVSDLLSEPELAPDLAAIALQRLSKRSDGGPLFGPLRYGHEVLLVLGPLDASSERQQEIGDVEIEMHYESISSVVYGRT
jgi:hypothetical protein